MYMKAISHFVRFWTLNRLVAVFAAFAGVLAWLLKVDNPYLNVLVVPVALMTCLCAFAYIDEGKQTASERLMLRKMSKC